MTTGTQIDTEARELLQDGGTVHWSAAGMIQWINAAVRDVITHKPKANTVTGNLTLTAGTTMQSLPATVIALVGILSNMGTSGTDPGRAVTLTSAERMDAARPIWRSDTGSAVKHYMVDDRDKSSYEVWPAPDSALKVLARTCNHPTDIAALTETLSIDDSYRNALVHYVLFKAYAQDAEDSINASLSAAHYAIYAQTIGLQVKKQKAESPGANSSANPAYPAVEKNGA